MEFEIELYGYKGKIKHIWAKTALPPWHPKDTLDVFIDFDEPTPEGIGGIAISIEAKKYSREELLATVRREGDKQLGKAINERIKEGTEAKLRRRAQERVNALAEIAERALE
jgi:hypothetical protein